MADNVAITAGAGTTVAADELVDATLGTVKAQYVKLMDGTLDSSTKVVAKTGAPAAADGGLVTRPLLYGADGNPLNAIADGTADTGGSLKVGGRVLPNSAALPAAFASGARSSFLADEFGRQRMVLNRPKLLGAYKFESGIQSVLASAHASTAGFFWLINPIGSTVLAIIKKLMMTGWPTAASAFVTSPRITIERTTFTGTASGASITPAKRDSNDAASVCSIRTASTGLTLTAGAICGDFSIPAVLTAVGIHCPVDQYLYDATDDDDYIVLRAGEGIICRQPDAGSTSDTRKFAVYGSWEER